MKYYGHDFKAMPEPHVRKVPFILLTPLIFMFIALFIWWICLLASSGETLDYLKTMSAVVEYISKSMW